MESAEPSAAYSSLLLPALAVTGCPNTEHSLWLFFAAETELHVSLGCAPVVSANSSECLFGGFSTGIAFEFEEPIDVGLSASPNKSVAVRAVEERTLRADGSRVERKPKVDMFVSRFVPPDIASTPPADGATADTPVEPPVGALAVPAVRRSDGGMEIEIGGIDPISRVLNRPEL